MLHFAELGRVVAEAVFLPSDFAGQYRTEEGLLVRPNDLAVRLHKRPDDFFDAKGNRKGGEGEYVVVLRPTLRDSRSFVRCPV